ncbi:MAG TPA: flagellar biosynthesis protein FlhF [Thiobacillaceae bacterium]|nr:flagellar biosynthesis protein FlhF [Thiobacillaceae bacterium]
MIKKFYASTTRDALRQVRDALGANAIILSNRQANGGVEIIAVADMDMAALASQAEPAPPPPAAPSPQPVPASATPRPAVRPINGQSHEPTPARAEAAPPPARGEPPPLPEITPLAEYVAQREASLIRSAREARKPAPAESQAPAAAAPAAAVPAPSVPSAPTEPDPAVLDLAREVRLLRGMVEGQLAGFAWSDITHREPVRAEIMKRLLAAGISASLARQLLDSLPAGNDLEKDLRQLKQTLAHNIHIADESEDILDKGGVYALVGPTGVGKTTTVAKLAARAVLKHGASKVALVSTDTYRIGAQDQLRIYGRILGTPVFSVRDENDLELTLADLGRRHLVFIDTVGMSQRDTRVAEQLALLSGERRSVQRILLLGAPSQGMTLEEVVRAYSGPGLIGCILTKIDEALSYGPVLDVVVRHQLTVHYVTNGQRVPEDLHLANALYLVDRAFRMGQAEGPFSVGEGDFPILMAAQEHAPLPDQALGGNAAGAAA